MTELKDRLQNAVGDSYRVERELGGGGMSRVFLAEETALHRKVVIKVLPPDMAAEVNKERFQREIQLSASLQHPHVVPLLTTGTHDDLLYYVMPLIEGESLRAKLEREGELPISEAVRILREVVDALAYAHRHDVVHRDIKPDNVLLTEDHAVVADFGVAKAVSASSGGTRSSLTSMGVALGTPAYMSPEQAAADPHVDHRADIYSVGVLAYEMLAGRPPFSGGTPQQVLAAHVSQVPEPISQLRDTVPVGLAELVMRCLAKRPADRWQSAAEFKAQLDAIATPQSGGITPTGTQPVRAVSGGAGAAKHHPVRIAALFGVASATILAIVYGIMIVAGLPDWVFLGAVILLAIGLPIMLVTGHHERARAVARTTGLRTPHSEGVTKHFTWRKAVIGGGLAFAGLTGFAGGFMGMRAAGIGPAATLLSAGVLGQRELLILAEFENRTPDSTLGSTVTELLRISLAESPAVRIADPPRIAESLARMQLDQHVRITEAIAREIAERESIKAVISGEVVPLGTGYIVSARLVSAGGEVLTAHQASASSAGEIIQAVDALSAKLRERIGESLRTIRRDLPLELVTTGSLEALRLYTQATQAEIAGDDDRAVALLEEAIAADTTFAMAYRKLGVILRNNFEQPARSIEALTKAYEFRDRLTPLERGYAVAQYHDAVTGDRAEALAAYRTILDKFPDDDRALNNSGVLYFQLGDYERSLEFYRRGLDVDSTWAPRFSNIATVERLLGRFDDAAATLDAMEVRFPGNPRVMAARADLASAQRHFAEAASHLRELRTSQSGNPFWQANVAENLGWLAATQGQFRIARRHIREAMSALEQRGVVSERLRLLVDFEVTRLLAMRDPSVARSVLDRELDGDDLAVLEVADRPYELLILFYVLAESVDEAGRLLTEMDRSGYRTYGRQFEQAYQRGAGLVSLWNGDTEVGVAMLREGIQGMGFKSMEDAILAQVYDWADNPDSSRVYWEAYIAGHPSFPLLQAWATPMAYRRLGELYEALGDSQKAAEYYSEFVELWKDADLDLQPQVEEVRNRIARLIGEGAR